MTQILRKGTQVTWHWSGHEATGKIVEVFREKVTRTIKGATITRDASAKEPAYLIEQEDGDHVLKSRSEVSRSK